jgi:hypothetical protein
MSIFTPDARQAIVKALRGKNRIFSVAQAGFVDDAGMIVHDAEMVTFLTDHGWLLETLRSIPQV